MNLRQILRFLIGGGATESRTRLIGFAIRGTLDELYRVRPGTRADTRALGFVRGASGASKPPSWSIFPPLLCALSACGGGGESPGSPPIVQAVPVIALTFDEHSPAVALSIMRPRGLVGTHFATPEIADAALLAELRSAGWSIQGYSGANMLDLMASGGEVAARARLAEVKRGMAAKGFNITALAPTSRAWNAQLRNLAADYYELVRVASDTEPQPFPFPDPLYVQHGGTTSLSSADTAGSLSAQLEHLHLVGGAWIVVIHKVGDDGDPVFSISAAVFSAFCDQIAAEVLAGKLRVVTL